TFFNTNQVLPFLEIDPSACFSSNGIANCDQPGVSSVGAVNGFTGPNTMFQADANESFQTTRKTPEPMSLTLLGLGLLGLAGQRRHSPNCLAPLVTRAARCMPFDDAKLAGETAMPHSEVRRS